MPPNNPQMPVGNQYSQSGMKPPKRRINILIIPVVALSVLLLASLGFGYWAYTEMQDYKNNSDKKVEAAVEIAIQKTSDIKDKEFLAKEKLPHKSYQSADVVGTVAFEYPKTWAAFITEDKQTNSGTPIDGYLHPNIVPGTQSGTDFALRTQVLSKTYSDVLNQYESKVKSGKVRILPFKAEKVPSVLGVRVDGEINPGQVNSMVILPIRDKTLLVWTESTTYLEDFNKIVLPTLSFAP